MRAVLSVAASFAAASVLAGCAAGAPPAGAERVQTRQAQQCFYADQVHSYSAPDEEHVFVRAGPNRVYELKMLGRCPDVDWSHQIGIQSQVGGRVCVGLDADIVVPNRNGGVGGPIRCPVRTVRQLSEEEIKAMKNRP